MPTSRRAAPTMVPLATARRLFLAGQGLLVDPARRATPGALCRQIEALGFVQVDTINVVCRAHHHILISRFDEYRPRTLERLLERDRRLFEHWTHDASLIPTKWLRFWLRRFQQYRRRDHRLNTWWNRRLGARAEAVLEEVRARIARDGPHMSRDFQAPPGAEHSDWWGWKPQKAALEYLWRRGELGVSRRINFHKVYDLMERIFPQVRELDAPGEEEHLDWVCGTALNRLGCATPGELAGFLAAVTPREAGAWCRRAAARGEVVEVLVPSADDTPPRRAFAFPDWRDRARRCPDPPDRMRLLSPFDPVVRDRRRLLRLFGFDYRFEAFVPAKKRRYGYFVLPVLEGERFVGRADVKLHRQRSALQVSGLWWEAAIRVTKKRRRTLDDALDRLAEALGAESVELAEGGTNRS
jgi:uncharacterized protein YcaQ